MVSKKDKNKQRLRRHARVRGKISGTAECPRLAASLLLPLLRQPSRAPEAIRKQLRLSAKPSEKELLPRA